MPVKESFLCFLDTETTGLIPGRDEVCEIGSVLTENTPDLAEVARIDMKVQLSAHSKMTPEAAKVNGYDPDVWDKEARKFSEWQAWLKEHVPYGHVAIPVGHNVGFDREMIYRRYYKPAKRFLPLSYHLLDTVAVAGLLKLSGRIDAPNLKLATVAAALGFEQQTHRAMDDCLLSKRILETAITLIQVAT